MSDYPDLSRWSDVDEDEERHRRPPLSVEARRILGTLDPVKDGFPLHEHFVYEDHADGSVTVRVPWSEFEVTVGPGANEAERKRAFGSRYMAYVDATPEEAETLVRVIREHGYLSVTDRLRAQGPE